MTYRFLLLILLLGLAACESEEDDLPVMRTEIPFRADAALQFLRPDSSVITTIAVEIAEGDSARARGLMDRRSLPARGGMLFLDAEPDTQRFWMESTPIPLDLIFVDEEGQVVNVARGRPYSRELISSTAPALYVVEVRAGFAERYGITDSTFIRWRRTEG